MNRMENSLEEQSRLRRAKKKVEAIKGFYKHLAVYLLVNTGILIAKAVNLEPDEHFFEIDTFKMAIFWGIGVLFHAFGVFGTSLFLNSNWEEKKIQEYMEKERRKGSKWE